MGKGAGDLGVQVFGKYRLLRRIAIGGMAEIYLAEYQGDLGFSKQVVIKRIHDHLLEDEEFLEMFKEEARLSSRLNHHNITQVIDFGNIEGSYFIAMEYVDGLDLASLQARILKHGLLLPFGMVLFIATEVCNALSYAHEFRLSGEMKEGVVHRDVSPQNILLSREGEIKLADFGIAKAFMGKKPTQAGYLKGKLAYMSPEQAWGKEIDHRSDIYSLGIILYELLTGRRLFWRKSDVATLEAVRAGKIEPLRTYDENIPELLEEAVLKALDRDPNKRYQTVKQLYNDLYKVSKDYNLGSDSLYLSMLMKSVLDNDIFGGKLELRIPKRKALQELMIDDALSELMKEEQGKAKDNVVANEVTPIKQIYDSSALEPIIEKATKEKLKTEAGMQKPSSMNNSGLIELVDITEEDKRKYRPPRGSLELLSNKDRSYGLKFALILSLFILLLTAVLINFYGDYIMDWYKPVFTDFMIITGIKDATIYVDGLLIGNSNPKGMIKLQRLRAGEHKIQVFKQGKLMMEKTINIPRRNPYKIINLSDPNKMESVSETNY